MPPIRLIAAVLGLLAPLSLVAAAEASPHRRHPAAHVRTATYRVAPAPRPPHRLRATAGHPRHLAQVHRAQALRRG